jgi:hypothetical protein
VESATRPSLPIVERNGGGKSRPPPYRQPSVAAAAYAALAEAPSATVPSVSSTPKPKPT